MRISDWSSDVCSSDLIWWRYSLPDGGVLSGGTLTVPSSAAGSAVSAPGSPATWIADLSLEWIPSFGIQFHLALDGLSLLMLLLTFFLGTLGVLCSWKEITERPGFFHFNLLWVLAGITDRKSVV